MIDQPKIVDAPGLTWRRRKNGWEARWQARSDLVRRGYLPKSRQLWAGSQLTPADCAHITDQCQLLQAEMLVWGRGGIPVIAHAQGTLGSLIEAYQTDPDSSYHKLRYAVRRNHDALLRRIAKIHGTHELAGINARMILRWHAAWRGAENKVAIAHMMVSKLRTLFAFGAAILEDEQCERLCGILHRMRFEMPKSREERLTAEQAIAIRHAAHAAGIPSIALAQALQFDLLLRQKDVIGEWVPMDEPGLSEIRRGRQKWLHGLRWSEIDGNLILRHMTSKKDKPLTIDLRLAPMVMEELAHWQPTNGALVVCEATGQPWITSHFRRQWREIANAAGIPPEVRNMDSRAGGITEATDAGVELEAVRHAATHSNIATTARYSRGQEEKIASVLRRRAAHRTNAEQDD